MWTLMLHLLYQNSVNCIEYNKGKSLPGISMINSCRGVDNSCLVGYVFSASKPFFMEKIASAVALDKVQHDDKSTF